MEGLQDIQNNGTLLSIDINKPEKINNSALSGANAAAASSNQHSRMMCAVNVMAMRS
jgi:hypothetical protein